MSLEQDEGYPNAEGRSWERQFKSQILPIIIVAVVVFCASVAACIGCCVYNCRKKRNRIVIVHEQGPLEEQPQQEQARQKQALQQESVEQADQPVATSEKQANVASDKQSSAV